MSETRPQAQTGSYVVRGHWPTGTGKATFLCPTPESALGKLRDFEKSDYTNITITGPDGTALSEADLIRLTEPEAPVEGSAPIDPDALRAPALVP